MYRKIISLLKAIATIAAYTLGIYLIYLYIVSDDTGTGTDQGAGGGAGVAIAGLLLLVIWTAIWYAIVYKIKSIYVKRKNNLDLHLTSFVTKIPVFSLLLILIYLFAISPLYFYIHKKIMLNRRDNLIEYLKKGQTEKALEIIQNKKIENYHYDDGTTLIYNASLYDQIIFDTLLNRNITYGNDLRVNSTPSNCVFCNLKTEQSALNAIEKMDFDVKHWDYGFSKSAFCDNKDLLIFFIKEKWHKCIEKYLEKCSERRQAGFKKNYNCQVKFYDKKNMLYDLKSVDPNLYSQDILTRIVLDQYEFQK